jgi:hypothetical protein
MIHHVSIPAREPQHVAEVLAELMGGKCYPFGPLEGAFMAASGDAHGTMIEVYPERATLDIPKNDDQVVFGDNASPPETWPFHVLLSVPLQPEQIEAIGAREVKVHTPDIGSLTNRRGGATAARLASFGFRATLP